MSKSHRKRLRVWSLEAETRCRGAAGQSAPAAGGAANERGVRNIKPQNIKPQNKINHKNEISNIRVEKYLKKHQIKKKFQFSLEWEKNQLAIWDNRSMLHQATPFNGNRIMHRITIK